MLRRGYRGVRRLVSASKGSGNDLLTIRKAFFIGADGHEI